MIGWGLVEEPERGSMDSRNTAVAVVAGVALGAVTGALLGLLFAPGSGEKTRADLEDCSDRLRDRTDQALGELRLSVEELVESTRRYMDDTRERVEASIEAGKQAAAETREQLSSVVEKQTGQSI
jgi:gas vesicle protein